MCHVQVTHLAEVRVCVCVCVLHRWLVVCDGLVASKCIEDKNMTDLSKEPWYHGRVSRVDAEKILDSAGGGEGTYLVRDSLTITGEYVLSLCHQV